MLEEHSALSAIKVEGVEAAGGSDHTWEGVDCSLYFGGDAAASADRVEFHQLKYSGSKPKQPWTAARLATGRNGKPSTSPIRAMAKAYAGLLKERIGKAPDTISVALVTNQPISDALVRLIDEARVSVPSEYKRAWKKGGTALHRLVHASGLTPKQFRAFANALDLRGSSGSRFVNEDKLLKTVSEWTDADLREVAIRLREYVRKRMIPENAGDIITREKVLLQFGVSEASALFPCPNEIERLENPIARPTSDAVFARMAAGQQYVCLHGNAGVGKSTTIQQIEALLTPASAMVVFDCYGGGSHSDASALRHRPEDAFLHLSNELARKLRLPMLLEPGKTNNAAREFRRRLEISSRALATVDASALLIIAIDAADNSVTAAQERSPPERSFVHELISFRKLPLNVRILVSARTGRLEELLLPSTFELISLPPFSRSETAANIARYWDAPADWIDDFHHLSEGVPRTQTYAFNNARTNPADAIDALRPLGKKLDQVFREQFQLALSRAVKKVELERVCAGLIALARPIPISELAAVLEIREAQIVDICADLAPGVRNRNGLLGFADEDFEDFVRSTARTTIKWVRDRAANRFLERAEIDAYAAFNVAPALLSAEQGNALLAFVEEHPEPPVEVVKDPVRRREIQLQRLLAAIRVCRQAGDPARALRFVLIGAEAIGTDFAIRTLLRDNPGLAACFARETASRLILGDPTRVSDHGPLILHFLAEDAKRRDAVAVREGRRRLVAWSEARDDDYKEQQTQGKYAQAWTIDPDDGAASLYATLLLDGAEQAVQHFSRFRGAGFALSSSRALIDRLVAERRFGELQSLANILPEAWSVFLLIPLAIARQSIDVGRLAKGLLAFKRRFSVDHDAAGYGSTDDALGPYVVDTLLTGAEILVARGGRTDVAREIILPFLEPSVRRVDKRHDFEAVLLDAILRSYCLAEMLEGRIPQAENVLTPRPPSDEAVEKSRRSSSYEETEHDRKLQQLISSLTRFYSARARAFCGARGDELSATLGDAEKQFNDVNWHASRGHSTAAVRARVSDSLTVLLAAGAPADLVMSRALAIRAGVWPHGESGAFGLFRRLTGLPELHSRLLDEVLKLAKEARRERTGAEDKSRTLAAYARLLEPISADDAAEIFRQSIEVASELDSEVMDQLRFIARLVDHGRDGFGIEARQIAATLSEVMHDGGIRLQNVEHFPWRSAFRALAKLDLPIALAAAARWDDTVTVRLSFSLASCVRTGLETGELSLGQASSLLRLLERGDEDDLRCLLTEKEGPLDEIAEELAQDVLLDRVASSKTIEDFISEHGKGYWSKCLAAQTSFENSLPKVGSEVARPRSVKERREFSIHQGQIWDAKSIVDPELLATVAEAVLEKSRLAKEYISLAVVLSYARRAVPLGNRLDHIKALAALMPRLSRWDLIRALDDATSEWGDQPAIEVWCRQELPNLIVTWLPDFTRYFPHETAELDGFLKKTQATSKKVQEILLEGIERNADALTAAVTFALAAEIGVRLDTSESASLCAWYVNRLKDRIYEEDLESIADADVPCSARDAVCRFHYAYLGDIDVRKRWRAAHGLRRLVRIGEANSLALVVQQYDRRCEPAFRDPKAPFYWVAARLWFVIALDRLSLEASKAVAPYGKFLLDVALNEDFPHLLLRDYAVDACKKLIAAQVLLVDATTQERLDQVNRSRLPTGTKERDYAGSFNHLDDPDQRKPRRFHFDGLDTLRYWYEPWLRAFEHLTPEHFLDAAEHWIVDQWGTVDEKPYGSKEPRQNRFTDYNWRLSYTSHGTLPTLERHRSYLEWHGMWCAAGQVLKTHRVRTPEYRDDDELRYQISQEKLSEPPVWLADLLGPRPLEPRRWTSAGSEVERFEEVGDDVFLAELMPPSREGFVVVDAYIDAKWQTHEETVRINSALVSPPTAHALVRALQTIENSFDYYLCPEGDDREIDDPEYVLRGWLLDAYRDPGLDKQDIFRNGVGRIESIPGSLLNTTLNLRRDFGPGSVNWFRSGQVLPSIIYEAWGEREEDERYGRYYPDTGNTRGHRLLVRAEDLAEFLETVDFDLITEVGVSRRDKRERRYSDDEEGTEKIEHDRVILFNRDGTLQAAERDLGAWRKHRT
jgi:hypothetical protein